MPNTIARKATSGRGVTPIHDSVPGAGAAAPSSGFPMVAEWDIALSLVGN
jgi:hypothetical protein